MIFVLQQVFLLSVFPAPLSPSLSQPVFGGILDAWFNSLFINCVFELLNVRVAILVSYFCACAVLDKSVSQSWTPFIVFMLCNSFVPMLTLVLKISGPHRCLLNLTWQYLTARWWNQFSEWTDVRFYFVNPLITFLVSRVTLKCCAKPWALELYSNWVEYRHNQ